MSKPSSNPAATTPAQFAAEVRAAILNHVSAERFAAVFANLPPAAQARISRKFAALPARFKVVTTRRP